MPAPRKPGYHLEFETPILHLEAKIREFKQLAEEGGVDLGEEVKRLEERAGKLRKAVYDHLTPGQRIQIARHPARPTALDYIQTMTDSFFEMHGDRQGHDDHAIVGGIGRFEGRSVMFIGHQKGRNTRDNIHRNFGMAHPEGYRKAMRLMRHAARFGMPIVTLIDTPGAYPGIAAEERGQAHAIAESMALMSTLEVPIITVVIGEGSSGGAIGIGMGNRVFMFEHAHYAVISPEGCAAILWKDASHAAQAAKIMKLTSHDLLELAVIDGIIAEPTGGCHRDAMMSSRSLARTVSGALEELGRLNGFQLLEHRHDRFRRMGQVAEVF